MLRFDQARIAPGPPALVLNEPAFLLKKTRGTSVAAAFNCKIPKLLAALDRIRARTLFLAVAHSREAFPQTRISLLEVMRGGDAYDKRVALEALTRSYWQPVFEYVRLKWRYSTADAEDLTQAFFARVVTHDTFARYDPAVARFRTFLRVCLDRFVMKTHETGQRQPVTLADASALDMDMLPARDAVGEPGDESEALLRDAWIRHFFERVVRRLEGELTAAGRTVHLELFRAYDLARSDETSRLTYGDLAKRFGIPPTQVTNFLAVARREFRRLVLDELRATAVTDADYASELRDLLTDGAR